MLIQKLLIATTAIGAIMAIWRSRLFQVLAFAAASVAHEREGAKPNRTTEQLDDGDLMRSAFHPFATISGYCQGVEYSGSVEHVFQWVTENGPAPNINPRFARIEIIESIAVSIWKFNVGQVSWPVLMPVLPTYSPCLSGMASGRSRINSSTGTTNEDHRSLRPEKAKGKRKVATWPVISTYTDRLL
jgi:hypothetical protein